jgi:hypothetical protein
VESSRLLLRILLKPKRKRLLEMIKTLIPKKFNNSKEQ